MAEKATTSKKRPARQQVLVALAEAEKTVAERREAQAKPEEKIEARAVAQAVAAADELSTEGVVKSIGELRSVVARMLTDQTAREQAEQIARLLAQSEKAYGQVQEIPVRAIEGSATAKQLTNLQQMLADQARKAER